MGVEKVVCVLADRALGQSAGVCNKSVQLRVAVLIDQCKHRIAP
jgi:hypothetical protein